MRIVSQLLPQKIRHSLRHSFDSLYSRPVSGKETIGVLSQWTIVPGALNEHSIVYSGGVGEDITFEQELVRRFNLRIHLFDPSPVAVRTVALAANDRLLFKPLGLAASTSSGFSVGGGEAEATWFKAGGDDAIACTTIPNEMSRNGHDHIDLLKIDIEGFEYEVLESCMSGNVRIKQLCVEFHDFFADVPKAKTQTMIRSLKSAGFELIHRHRHDHTFLNRHFF